MVTRIRALGARARHARFVRHGASLSLGSAASALGGAIQGILAARLLGPAGFGAVAVLVALPTVVFTIFDGRSDVTTVRFLTRYLAADDGPRAATVCRLGIGVDLAVGACTFAVVAALGLLAPSLLPDVGGAAALASVYAASLIVLGLQPTSTAILSALDRFDVTGRVEAVLAAVRLVIVVAAATAFDTAGSVVLAYAAANVCTGVVSLAVASGLLRRRTGRSLRHRGAPLGDGRRDLTRFLALSNLSELASLPFKQLDVLLVGSLLSVAGAGQYKLAKSVTALLALPIAPLQAVLYRRLVDEPTHRRELLRQARLLVGPALAAAIAAGSIGLASLAPTLIGADYTAARGSILAWGAGFALWGLLWWLRPVFFAEGRLGSWLGLNIAASVVFVGLAVAMLRRGSGVTELSALRSIEPIVVVYLGGLLVLRRGRRGPVPAGTQAGEPAAAGTAERAMAAANTAA